MVLQTLVQTAFENGINTFDTAETYGEGKSELELYGNVDYFPSYLTRFKGTCYQGVRLQALGPRYHDQDLLGSARGAE